MAAQKMTLAATTSAFVGRQHERARIEDAIDRAVAGSGSLVLIGGEPGIGKTSLMEQAATHAQIQDMPVLWAKCWDDEGGPAYRPWVQLIRGLLQLQGDETLDDLGPIGSDLAQIVPELAARYEGAETAPATEPAQARLRLFDSVLAFLTRATAPGPVLVAIDDIHAADTPTLKLLRAVAHELRRLPLVILATYRDTEIGDDHPVAGLLEESLPHRETIELHGLAEADISVLVGEMAVAPAGRLAVALHRRTDGNPLFVKEFLRLLESQQRLGAAADVGDIQIPVAISEVIRRRVARLSEGCHRLLQVAAVIGESFDLEVLTTASDRDEGAVLILLDEAIAARLVTVPGQLLRQEFAHPLVRETIYDNIATLARSQLHAQVGGAFERIYGNEPTPHLEELAYHFVRALPADAHKAVDYSERAGLRALTRLAYEEAVSHFQNALSALGGTDRERRLELLLQLGDAELRAGSFEDAKKSYLEGAQLARDEGSAEGLARAALGLGAGLTGFEITLRDQAQIDLLEDALEAIGDEDSSLRARLMARLSIALAYVAPMERRVELSLEAAAIAQRVGDPAARAYALSTFCDAESNPGKVRERLEAATEMVELAQSVGDKEMELLGRRFRVVSLMELGDRVALYEEIDNYQRVAEFLRQPLLLWYAPLFRAAVALTEGRLEECERLGREASAIAQRAQSQNAFWLIDLSLMPELRTQQGDLPRARELLEPALQELKTHTGVNWPSIGRAWAHESDQAAARAELARLASTGIAEISRDGTFLPLTHYLVHTAAALGETSSAEVLYRELLPYEGQFAICSLAAACYGNVGHNLGMLATTLGRWEEAEKHFESAIRAHAAIGALPLLAHSRREYASMLLKRGHKGDEGKARDLLRDAIASYRDLGMTGWLERVQALLEPLPEPGSVTGNLFRNEGGYWTVTYDGAIARMKDSKGMRDIARLLAEPGREIHAADLAGSGGASVIADGDVVMDEQARAALAVRLKDLRDEIDEADANNDQERAARLREELEFIQAEVSSAYGIGGRPRKIGDTGERARKAVTARIKDALARISAAHSSLGRHLDRSINTGTFCSYTPETPVKWDF